MKKVIILGCENSHANTFLNFIAEGKYPEIDVIGVYSDDSEASLKLNREFGVTVMERFDQFENEVDGVIITARHGDNHYKYAQPYINKVSSMFIDKPITIDENEAITFMKQLKAAKVRISGGSCCKHIDYIQKLKSDCKKELDGKTEGGLVRAPLSLENPYGNFFFYAQHLVEMVLEVYGHYPKSVKAFKNGKNITVLFRYENYDITGLFIDGNYYYYAARYAEKSVYGSELNVDPSFRAEFEEFYDILIGGKQKADYKDFIAPVFVMNAIDRSLKSGKEESVKEYEV